MRFVPVSASAVFFASLAALGCSAPGPEVGAARLTSATPPANDGASANPSTPRSPSGKTPTPVEEPPNAHVEPGVVRILVTGDLAPERSLASPGRIGDALAPLRPLFQSAQAVVVQQVGVVGDGERAARSSRLLLAPPAWLGQVASAHIAAVAVANAHACDAGRVGIGRTLDRLSDLGVLALGMDGVDPLRARVLAVNDGHRVCGLAWTTRVRGTECADGKVAVAHGTAAGIAGAVTEARERCDAIVAIADGVASSSAREVRAIVEAGVDAVVLRRGVPGASGLPAGAVVLTSASGKRVPVFESLGSLAAGRAVASSKETPFGLVADLTFKWEGASRAPALSWGYDLVTTERDGTGANELVLARPLDAADAKRLDAAPRSESAALRRLFASPCWRANGPGCR